MIARTRQRIRSRVSIHARFLRLARTRISIRVSRRVTKRVLRRRKDVPLRMARAHPTNRMRSRTTTVSAFLPRHTLLSRYRQHRTLRITSNLKSGNVQEGHLRVAAKVARHAVCRATFSSDASARRLCRWCRCRRARARTGRRSCARPHRRLCASDARNQPALTTRTEPRVCRRSAHFSRARAR